MKLIIVTLLTILIASCTSVETESPIGTKPVELDEQEWNGMWNGDGFLLIKVRDSKKGIINIGFIDDDGDKFEVQNLTGYVKEHNDIQFINIKVSDVAKSNGEKSVSKNYLWFPFTKDGNGLVIYVPNEEFFEKLDGAIISKEGKYSKNIKIKGSTIDLSNSITKNSDQSINWKKPAAILRRGLKYE